MSATFFECVCHPFEGGTFGLAYVVCVWRSVWCLLAGKFTFPRGVGFVTLEKPSVDDLLLRFPCFALWPNPPLSFFVSRVTDRIRRSP